MTDGKKTVGETILQAMASALTRDEYVGLGELYQQWARMTDRYVVGIGPDTHEHTLPGRDHHSTTLNPRSTPESTPATNASDDGTKT